MEALWEDVLESRAAPFPHYMGALVLQRVPRGPFQVIDGQQRLATLVVACVAVLELLRDRGDLQRYDLLRARYVGSPDPGSLRWQSKLVLNETDDAFFQEFIVNLKALPPHTRLRGSNRRLWDALEFFRKKWRSVVPAGADGEALVGAFQDDGHAAFTTTRGRRLTPTRCSRRQRPKPSAHFDRSQELPVLALKGGRVDPTRHATSGGGSWRQWMRRHSRRSSGSMISRRKLVRADRLFKALRGGDDPRQAFALLDGLMPRRWYRALAIPTMNSVT